MIKYIYTHVHMYRWHSLIYLKILIYNHYTNRVNLDCWVSTPVGSIVWRFIEFEIYRVKFQVMKICISGSHPYWLFEH